MKFGVFLAFSGALLVTLAATPSARAQTPGPVVPFNLGDAVRAAEEARQPPLPQPAAVPVLPQVAEPQFTMKDKETLFVRSHRARRARSWRRGGGARHPRVL